ncbi:MAG: nucleotide exchange factor GrpE [Candidatus Omnitrophica bacterium]|nr:nucleotide exchange factor GrpE [Candidatus Omnitrophota bacterium]
MKEGKKEKKEMKEEEQNKEVDFLSGEERKELEKKTSEYEAVWDKYVRMCAEFENARKRWSKEREDLMKFANFSLLKDMVVILDELGQALKITKEHQDFEKIVQGIELTYNNFSKILKNSQVMAIDAQGKQFDPHIHEIVASREVEDDNLEHVVLEEVMKGYMLGGKVLRTSRVIIGIKKKPETSKQKPEEESIEETKEEGGETRDEV